MDWPHRRTTAKRDSDIGTLSFKSAVNVVDNEYAMSRKCGYIVHSLAVVVCDFTFS